MAAPQGLFQFAGTQALFSGSFTLATGISPSVCNLDVAPGSSSLRIGPLVLRYGSTMMTWSDCIVDAVESRVDESGFITWSVSILDRRWKWRGLGKISGQYNTRTNGVMIESTRKSAKKLVELCLNEMKERNYDIAAVPTTIYPEVDWDYEAPAEALASLCDDLGLVVVLDNRDTVRIMAKGQGPLLPRTGSEVSYSQTVNAPEVPSEVIVVGGQTRYVAGWKLEAVGVEADGAIKPIDELSYKPADGWSTVDIKTFFQVDEESRQLAQESVFRWYRIRCNEEFPFEIEDKKITNLWQLLPTDDDVEEVRRVSDTGETIISASYVKGVFYNGQDNYGVWYDDKEEPPEVDDKRSLLADEFRIDAKQGIVKFREPVYQLYIGSLRAGGSNIEPADLWWHIGLVIRDESTRAAERHEFRGSRNTGSGAPPRYVIRDELIKVKNFADGKWRDNLKELTPQASAIRKQIEAEYQTQQPAAAVWDGIIPVSPSGATPSVTWTIDESGRSSTRATIHIEDYSAPIPTRNQSRFAERARAANAKKRVARAERERLRRAGG